MNNSLVAFWSVLKLYTHVFIHGKNSTSSKVVGYLTKIPFTQKVRAFKYITHHLGKVEDPKSQKRRLEAIFKYSNLLSKTPEIYAAYIQSQIGNGSFLISYTSMRLEIKHVISSEVEFELVLNRIDKEGIERLIHTLYLHSDDTMVVLDKESMTSFWMDISRILGSGHNQARAIADYTDCFVVRSNILHDIGDIESDRADSFVRTMFDLPISNENKGRRFPYSD